MASLCLGVVRTCPRVCVRAFSSLTCRDPRRILPTRPQYPVCRVCCCHLCLTCAFFEMFVRLVLIKFVFHDVCDFVSPLLVFDRSYVFLDSLACVLFLLVCLRLVLCWVLSFCVVVARRDILEFVVEVFCCRAVSRRVGVGRVGGCGVGRAEGLILVCLVSVYCVFVQVEFVATASALFLMSFSLVAMSVEFCGSSVFRFVSSLLYDRCSCRSVLWLLHLCSVGTRPCS